jgi:tetratricopeptide (TPR) repeat protein
MRAISRLISSMLVVALLVTARWALAADWIGKKVMPKSDRVALRSDEGPAADIFRIQWPATVRTMDGSWLRVQDDGGTSHPQVGGWLRAADVVTVPDALDYYNGRLLAGDDSSALYWLRAVSWENAREFSLALKDYQESLRRGGNPDARLGLARMTAKVKYDDQKFTDAWRASASAPRLYIDWGQALEADKQLDRAEAMYREAARRNPQWRQPHYALGKLAAARGKYHDALSYYEEAIRRDAAFHAAHRDRAAAWLAMNPSDETHSLALGSARRACELCLFREAESLAVLAQSFAAIEQWPEARRFQEMAVEYAPTHLKPAHKARWVQYAKKAAPNLLASSGQATGEKTRGLDTEELPPATTRGPRTEAPIAEPAFIDRSGQSFQ